MEFNVVVSGWSRSRKVIQKGDKVTMEVARINCSHCPTCQGRMEHVRRTLSGEETMNYVGGGVLVTVPLPKGEIKTKANIAKFLGNKFGLNIRPA